VSYPLLPSAKMPRHDSDYAKNSCSTLGQDKDSLSHGQYNSL